MPPALTTFDRPPVVTAPSPLLPPFLAGLVPPAPPLKAPASPSRPPASPAPQPDEVTIERIAATLDEIAALLRHHGSTTLATTPANPLAHKVLRVIHEYLASLGVD